MSNFRSHYEYLQVLDTASIEVIRGAYKHLSQKWHPDKHPNDRQCAESIIKNINTAYSFLSDPEKRKEYDAWLEEQRKKTCKPSGNKNEYKERSTSKKKRSNQSSYNKSDKSKKRQYHPWRRFLARNIDLLTIGLIVYFYILGFIDGFAPEKATLLNQAAANEIIAGFLVYILWMPVEAVFLCTLGTTPAKWVFGIFIKKIDGSNLSFSEAIYRVFNIFLKGEWLGIAFLKLIPNYYAYQKLNATGETSWDTEIRAIVTHKKWGIFRATSAIALTCLTLVLFSIINQVDNQNKTHAISSKNNPILDIQPENSKSSIQTKVDNYSVINNQINLKRTIQINNECQESITAAITYWNGNEWESTGWWKVSPVSVISTNLKTDSKNIYVYAFSENYIWKGDAETGTIQPVSNSGYVSTPSNPVNSNDVKTASFLLANITSLNDKESYKVNLFCSTVPVNKSINMYSGEKISMNLQGIEIRTVLQIFSDFSETKIIASEKITGLVNAVFNDTPWDEAMESIIHSRGYISTKIKGTIYVLTPHELKNLRNYKNIQKTNTYQTTITKDKYSVKYGDGRIAEITGDIKSLRKNMRDGLLK